MKTNALFVRSFLVTAILFAGISWAAVAQTTGTVGLRLTGSTYHVFITPTSTATTDLLDATQIAVTVPTGSSFNVTNITSALPGVTWSLGAPKDTYNGSDYFIIIPSAVAGGQTFTAGQEKELFSFSNTGTCAGQVSISPVTTFTPLPGGADGSTYLAFTNNGGGGTNGFTGVVTQSAPCQALTITNTASISTAQGTSKDGSVATDANPTGGTGTNTYTSVLCDGTTPSPTTPSATNATQQGGTVSVNSTTGAYTYTPAPNFTGTDRFCVRVCSGNDCKVLTYTATVTPASTSTCVFTLPRLSKS